MRETGFQTAIVIRGIVHRCCLSVSLMSALFVVSGCGGSGLEYREVKRIDEKVTQEELDGFLRVVNRLPDHKLPKLPTVFPPPPNWNRGRTLPVSQLVDEERSELANRWSVEWIARRLEKNRRLQHALRLERMTTEQFVGLMLTLGVTLSRSTLHDHQNLGKILAKGKEVIAQLKRDSHRRFAELNEQDRYTILVRAIWIARVDRAARLKQVPPENLALVREHYETLAGIFPLEFTTNPFDSIVDRMESDGLPFQETIESGRDDRIAWRPDRALIGHDRPDVITTDSPIRTGSRTVRNPSPSVPSTDSRSASPRTSPSGP